MASTISVEVKSGRDRVGGDVESGHFQGESFREGNDTALAGRVIGLAKCAHLPDNRADINNASKSLIDHGRDGRAGAIKCAVQVDIDHCSPILVGHFAHASIPRNTCVVHQDVETLPFVKHLFDDASCLAFLSHITLDKNALDTQLADLFGSAFGLFGIRPEVQGYVCATAREFKRDCASNAASGTGHQGNLTGERSRLIISTSICNVCHLDTPVFRIAAHDFGIDPHNHVAANRTGAKARRKDPHGTVNPPFAHGVMDGHENTGGRSIANPFDVEEDTVPRYSGRLGQGEHHVLIGLVRNDQIDCVDDRPGRRWGSEE